MSVCRDCRFGHFYPGGTAKVLNAACLYGMEIVEQTCPITGANKDLVQRDSCWDKNEHGECADFQQAGFIQRLKNRIAIKRWGY